MDKGLIVVGLILLYGAYAGKQKEYVNTFFGVLADRNNQVLLGLIPVLFIVAKYSKQYSAIPASILLLIALNMGLKKT